MPLDFQTVPVAFTQGQDTRTQQKLVIHGKWLSLINYSLSADNTPRRRDGSAQLVAGTIANGLALHGSELLAVAGQQLSSYSPGQAAMEAKTGEMSFVSVSKTEVQRANNMQDSPDCASGVSGSGTYTAYVWRDLTQFGVATGINCTVVDETTGVKLLDNVQVHAGAGAFCPRVVFASGSFFFFYIEGAVLYGRCLTPSSSLSLGLETLLVNSGNLADINFDACDASGGGVFDVMVVYGWADGTTSVRSIGILGVGNTPSIVKGPTNLVANATVAIANVQGMCCAAYTLPNPSSLGCFVLHTGGVSGVVINASWAVTTAVTALDAFSPSAGYSHICACSTGTGIQVFSDQQAAWGTAALSPIRTGIWNTTLGVVRAAATLTNSASFSAGAAPLARGPQGPWICGKPFAGPQTVATSTNHVILLPVCVMENAGFGSAAPNNNTQCTWFLLDGTTGFITGGAKGVVVAKALYGSYGVPSINSVPPAVSTPCSSPAIGSGFATLVNERTTLVISNGLNVSPTGLCRLTLTPNTTVPPIRAELGPVTYFSGGQLCSYDGSQVVEHGFPLFPEGVGAKIGAGAGMTDGVHQIVAIYEWFDAQGQRHQSSESLPVSVTAGGGSNQATVKVPSLLLSQKSGVNIVLYMTQAGGLEFNRLTLRSGHPVANDTTAAFVTVVITESDAAIAGNELLYTQPNQAGSTLPNDSPPPCVALCVSQNRLWTLSADALEYRYSQELLNGFGLQFNGLYGDETLGGLLPSDSGGGVTVAPLDEKTIILCGRKLYVVFGTAPESDGSNGTLTEPQEIPSPVGCSDARSVLPMPQGLIFKSQSGWYLLGRDLNVQYIGAGVTDYDSYSVTSATLMHDRQECRFEVQSGVTVGPCLVFSYLVGQWSIFARGDTFPASVAAFDALWYPQLNRYLFLTTQAPVGLFQDVPLFDSDGAATGADPDDFASSSAVSVVKTRGKTAWLKLAALEGYQRVRRIYLTSSPLDSSAPVGSTLTIETEVNDDSTVIDTVNADLSTLTAMGTIDLRHKLSHQKNKSVSFTFTETPNDFNQNLLAGLQVISLEIGVKKGVFKLPAGQTV